MSWEALSAVSERVIGSPSRRLVLMVLANHASKETGAIFPSVARLAAETEMTERSVKRILAAFRREGLLVCVHKATPRRPATYNLSYDKLAELPPIRGDTESPQGCQRVTPGVTQSHPRGDTESPELKDKPKRTKEDGRPKNGRPRDELFDAISLVCQADPRTAGSSIGKVRANLLRGGYTAQDVYAFRQWWDSDPWRKSKGPPTVWKLQERIGVVREQNLTESELWQLQTFGPMALQAYREEEHGQPGNSAIAAGSDGTGDELEE